MAAPRRNSASAGLPAVGYEDAYGISCQESPARENSAMDSAAVARDSAGWRSGVYVNKPLAEGWLGRSRMETLVGPQAVSNLQSSYVQSNQGRRATDKLDCSIYPAHSRRDRQLEPWRRLQFHQPRR